MFCPECRSEYRSGFTRCADCDIALVEDLSKKDRERAPAPLPAAPATREPMLEYCGFFTVEEARQARDQLRLQGIRSEILIREADGSDLDAPPREEFWLRVGRSGFDRAAGILGYHEQTEPAEGEAYTAEKIPCPACGDQVASDEAFCPGCGIRFEAR